MQQKWVAKIGGKYWRKSQLELAKDPFREIVMVSLDECSCKEKEPGARKWIGPAIAADCTEHQTLGAT
jgi:hypothetical protein